MLTESERRALALAVSRYGADRGSVIATAQAVLEAKAAGEPADLLEALVARRLLTSSQADELRGGLDITQLDSRPRVAAVQQAQPCCSPGRQQPGSAASEEEDLIDFGQDIRQVGEFRILRRLGEGGMGSVFLGYHEEQGRQVAIKILPQQLAENRSYVERFYREAQSVTHLDHPNIVQGMAVGWDEASDRHYLVLEYVDGPSVHVLIDRFGRLPVGDAVHIILDVARALEHAHSRNIVHRDIKPDNILLSASGVAKLTDLGLAKRTDEESQLTGARQGFGTPYYMPYEQAVNAKQADCRSDVYALGATLYHMLTGDVPFSGSNPLEVAEKKMIGAFRPAGRANPEVPARLETILAKMLARDPDDRYQTASELIVDLERSGLAAAVPSFVDLDVALRDPLVRARLTTPAQPTQLDPRSNPQSISADDTLPNVWYLRRQAEDGTWSTTRATSQQILKWVSEGRLDDQIEVSEQPRRGFRPLNSISELHAPAAPEPQQEKARLNGTGSAEMPRPELLPANPEPQPAPRVALWMAAALVVVAGAVALVAYLLR